MEKPELVLLDLDGTLVDSVPHLTLSIDSMLRDLKMEPVGEENVSKWVGNGAEPLVKRALTGEIDCEPDNELFQKAFALFSDYYIQFNERSRLYPGVRDAIEHLKALSCKLGCITNKRAKFTEPLLRSLGVHDAFHIIISGDTLPKKKPDPLPLLHAAESLGVGLDKTLMIGDSRNDIEAARAAGVPVLCVNYGYNHGVDIADDKPDYIVNSLSELKEMIN